MSEYETLAELVDAVIQAKAQKERAEQDLRIAKEQVRNLDLRVVPSATNAYESACFQLNQAIDGRAFALADQSEEATRVAALMAEEAGLSAQEALRRLRPEEGE